jgi:hypothetical protein
VAVVLKHVSEPLTLPRIINPNIPDPLEQVVVKAMAKAPEQRYQTAGEMQRALQQALRDIESGSRTVNMPSATSQPQTQNITGAAPVAPKTGGKIGPWLIGGAAIIALLCLLGGGLLTYGLMVSGNDPTGTPSASRPTAVSIGIEKRAIFPPPQPKNSTMPPPSRLLIFQIWPGKFYLRMTLAPTSMTGRPANKMMNMAPLIPNL